MYEFEGIYRRNSERKPVDSRRALYRGWLVPAKLEGWLEAWNQLPRRTRGHACVADMLI